ncbi:MAG TPA: adenylate/guanylate cyclase domain-containing protein [Burkholderiales bacterium]|nr:adenylate/guanylate cyclase domain-containing protein [Burkholderiales bacterium]
MRQWRARLRLASALVLLSFVLCHLAAHSVLLISEPLATSALTTLMQPWRSGAGTALLLIAFLVHYANALWAIYERSSLRLKRWEWAQLGLGLLIPVLLALHIAATRISEAVLGTDSTYTYILTLYWVLAPHIGVLQALALLTVWIHACIGVHFWLRTKRWYPDWRVWLGALALLYPTLALTGYLSAGNQLRRDAAKDPVFVQRTLEDANATPATPAMVDRVGVIVLGTHAGLLLLVFAARGVRRRIHERRMPPMLTHPSCKLAVLPGATVLETLRDHGIPHASVCGGRARCTTCRIHVGRGAESLPAPHGLEAKALERIRATPGTRLACQIRPSADLSITPLLAADASAEDGFVPGGLEGTERPITVMFVDLRGSTTLGEAKLPYDVLFILNRFFYEMKEAMAASNGHYSQFTGDGLMALYGLHADDPDTGPAEALRGAREMLMRLEQLNHGLKGELAHPLQIGIGIHHSEAIVGAMGPPRSQIITAIGDTVNTTARLESLTKEYGCEVIISRQAAEIARLDVTGLELHKAPVKGRVESVEFYALRSVS